jgi:hypothetical protein
MSDGHRFVVKTYAHPFIIGCEEHVEQRN